MKKRVVITGIGIVSSIGIGKDDFWNNLIAGKSGISEVSAFDVSNYDIRKGGEIKNFEPENFIPKNRLKELARASQFAIALQGYLEIVIAHTSFSPNAVQCLSTSSIIPPSPIVVPMITAVFSFDSCELSNLASFNAIFVAAIAN